MEAPLGDVIIPNCVTVYVKWREQGYQALSKGELECALAFIKENGMLRLIMEAAEAQERPR